MHGPSIKIAELTYLQVTSDNTTYSVCVWTLAQSLLLLFPL